MDIKPRRPRPTRVTPVQDQPEPRLDDAVEPVSQPINLQPIEDLSTQAAPAKPPAKRRLWWIIGVVVGFIVIVVASALTWYTIQLQPPNIDDKTRTRLEITPGMTPDQIADLLKDEGLIRDTLAFIIYARLQGVQNSLQAGQFSISPSESVPQVVEHLLNGESDEFTITFLPGAALTDSKADIDHRRVLLRAGYSQEEIDRAFSATYDHPLLADRPAGASLEGYIYGETYQISSGSTVESILERTFDQFYKEIQEANLIQRLKAKGYTLHQGITFASIIQREEPGGENQRQVAGVFTNRLEIDMMLQSDPTFIYAARQIGAQETSSVDSPYNTYRNAGLPPGPIASPKVSALEAVVNPEPSEYLYFLSGDDDRLYFGRTIEEHERNIQNYCQEKCFSY